MDFPNFTLISNRSARGSYVKNTIALISMPKNYRHYRKERREYKTFFSWIFFGTSNLVTCLFLSIPCRLSNGDTAAAKWDPHVILYVQ